MASITFIDLFELQEDDPRRINIEKLTNLIDYRIGDISDIRKIIEDENTDLRVTGWMIKNPIESALHFKNIDALRLMFESNETLINMVLPCGLKPVHIAATRYVDCLKILIPFGIDFESKSPKENLTPLACACRCGKYEVIQFLLEEVGVEIDEKSRSIVEKDIQWIDFKLRVLELFEKNTFRC